MTEQPKQSSATDTLWKRLDEQSRSIVELARSQERTDTQLKGLSESVASGFARIERHIDELQRPTNWVSIISAVVATLALGGTIMYQALNPLDERLDRSEMRATVLQEFRIQSARMHGEQEKSNEWHSTWLGFLERQIDEVRDNQIEVVRAQGVIEGRQEQINIQLQSIETGGTRSLINKN